MAIERKAAEKFELAGEIKLKNPLLVDGKYVKVLKYDFDKLSVMDLIDAENEQRNEDGNVVILAQLDSGVHLRVFAKAVQTIMDNVEYTDLKRLSLADGKKVIARARRFFTETDDEDEDDLGEAETSGLVLAE